MSPTNKIRVKTNLTSRTSQHQAKNIEDNVIGQNEQYNPKIWERTQMIHTGSFLVSDTRCVTLIKNPAIWDTLV